MFDFEFHRESLEDYFGAWRDSNARERLEMTLDEAAFHVLVHCGLLARRNCPNGCRLPACVADMPPRERTNLVRSACSHVRGFSFPVYYHELFARDDLDVDEFAEAEGLLVQRDEWDAALWMAGQLVDDQLDGDEVLLSELALAHSVAAAFDEELFKQPDVVAAASRVLDEVRGIERIGRWFQRARDWDREFNDPKLSDVLAAAQRAFETSPVSLPQEASQRHPAHDYALAAGACDAWNPLIDRLASEATDEVSEADYRNAWAHFLAATYCGTTRRAGWRDKFVQLASDAGPLSDDWRERHRRAEELERDRDWERRYSGEAAYRLEPRPIKNRGELLDWLGELTEPASSR